ncbi:MAG TPA: sulfotransferase [Solirubrobacteraceae bacterium]|nr:sulfotransferase [Solirubrobacteraceae bacterium]
MQASNPQEQLQVLGAGFGRTGTLSLKVALEELGVAPCLHSLQSRAPLSASKHWQRLAAGEQIDWREALAGFRSSVDWLCARYYEQILEAFPQVKVVLSVREPQAWYESASASLHAARSLRRSSPDGRSQGALLEAVDRAIWQELFDGRFCEREHALAVFDRHSREVIARVPASQLLVYDVREGWAPLCAFLGVPEPSTPFPHLNGREVFWTRIGRQAAGGEAEGQAQLGALITRRPQQLPDVAGAPPRPRYARRIRGEAERARARVASGGEPAAGAGMQRRPSVRIGALACVDGPRELSQQEVLDLLGLRGEAFAEGVFARCGVQRRCLDLDAAMLGRSLQGRSARVEELLLERSCAAFELLGADPSEVSTVISASLVSLGCPSLAHRLIERLGMDPSTDKYHLTGVGCASAVPLVRLGAQALAGDPTRKVLVVAAESMSALLCQASGDDPRAKTIGSAIFGDGCAALLLEAERPGAGALPESGPRPLPEVIASAVHQVPSSLDAVAMACDSQDSYLGLIRELPDIAGAQLRPLVDSFLARHALTAHMVDHWLLHPGGRRIIECAQSALGLDRDAVAISYEVLADRGNVGTPSIFYVLERTLRKRAPQTGQHGLLVTIGPGVTVGLMLVRF